MNSNVHPFVVFLVLVLTGIAIATWMWGSGAAANIGGPSELKIDSNGHAYVQIQDVLVEHGADGQYRKTHDLGKMGVDLFLGSFDFFSNGDILLRRGADPRSFGDNVRAFQRQTNKQSIEPDSPGSGLFRCNLETQYCQRFGEAGLDFKAAHGIVIDRTTDEVYISDTTRHLIRKYSSDGLALADPVGGFKFPNQILIHDEKLFVADTNHHEIRIVNPLTEFFGEEFGRENVTPELANTDRQDWPSHFIRVDDKWWINNMRTGMNQGGIYIFDDEWRLIRKLDLPDDADPIALLAFGDTVWISDWYNDKVRRFTRAGEPLTDLDSVGLQRILASSQSERTKFELISYSGIGLNLLILGGLAARGFAVTMSTDSTNSRSGRRKTNTVTADAILLLEPDNKVLRRMTLAVRVMVALLLILGVSVGYLIAFHPKPEFGYGLVLPGVGIFLIVALINWINRSNTGTAIRIDGNVVTLRDYSGRESNCSLRDICYDDTAIASPDAAVFFGRPPASVYSRKDLKEKLFPRLVEAKKVSPMQMQKILIQRRHPQGVTTVLAFVAVSIYAVWVIAK